MVGIIVRKATLNDLNFITDELTINAQFYGKPLSTTANLYDTYSQKVLSDLITNHVFLICEKDGKPVGLMVGYLHNHLFNPKIKCMSEILLWVKQSERNTRAAYSLMKRYSEIAEDYDYATMAINTKSNLTVKSLARFGFIVNEVILTKEKGAL